MRKEFIVTRVDPAGPFPNRGKPWSVEQSVRLKSAFSGENSMQDICTDFGRTPGAILSQAVLLRILEREPREGTSYIYRYFYREAKQPINQPTEEITMTTPNIEVKTFIAGADAAAMTDGQIFQKIAQLENEIAKLSAIKTKPKKLVSTIEKLQEDINLLVQYVDDRPAAE